MPSGRGTSVLSSLPGEAMKRLAVAGAALILVEAAPISWKLYGNSTLGWGQLRSFYGDVALMPNGHLQISTKDLTLEGLDVAKQSDPNASRGSAKLATGYRPPLASLGPLSSGALLDILEFEEIANSGLLKPRTESIRELDCAGKKFRTLSVVEDSVEVDTAKLNQSWLNILPGTTGSNLLQLVCH